MAEVVDARTDWLETLSPAQQATLRDWIAEDDDLDYIASRWLYYRLHRHDVDEQYTVDPKHPHRRQTSPSLYRKFLDELHDFLCSSDEKYQDERTGILKDFRTGQAAVVATVATAVAPYIGVGSSIVAPAVAVVLTIIKTVGLNAWCAAQAERRSAMEPKPPEDSGTPGPP